MLLPTKARYAPGEPVVVDLSPAPNPRTLTVEHLGTPVAIVRVPAGARHTVLPELPEGGYALAMEASSGAVEVLADPVARLRYGFVADYAPARDVEPVLRAFRRLHLTGAQFYDWGYRHADLVGGGERYADPLGQQVCMPTVRALSQGLRRVGTLPIGYAAVYAVGDAEWPRWRHIALLRPDGTAYSLADFLSIVDPSDAEWLDHFCADLDRALVAGGFAGFHLDQYGFPRRAVRRDGRTVDVAAAFDTMIHAVRNRLPQACLIFNNVNDFPVWRTSRSPQDATYIEVWEPHDTLGDLAAVSDRARALAPGRPVVLAAYQTVYGQHPSAVADTTTRLTMATAFSHGATQLLAGESGRLLVDPYYVRNHVAEQSTMDMLTRWYDLLVAAGDVLFANDQADVTGSVVGGLNDEVDVVGAAMSHVPRPDAVWRRVVETDSGLLVHLINLTGQTETGWDTAKEPIPTVAGLRVRMRRVGTSTPVVHSADPETGPRFRPLQVTTGESHHEIALPPLTAWQVVLIRYGQQHDSASREMP